MDEYVICIPSYKRSNICNDKTLATLHKHNIESKHIYVYVANKEEYELYETALNKGYYNKIIIGKLGLVPQRQFISNGWPSGKHILFLDDDIEKIDLSLSPQFKSHSLDYFIRSAFQECLKQHSYIWGVYAVYNPFFRKGRKEITTDLNYIVGAFYGIINRPTLKQIQLILTKENGQKEDVERTLLYFMHDGIVIRYNRIGFLTKYYGKEGGLGRFEERLKPMSEASKRLKHKYGEYGDIKVKGNGMTEFVLKKVHAFTPTHNGINKINKNKTKKNKTKKTEG